jgi:hypothetical protein
MPNIERMPWLESMLAASMTTRTELGGPSPSIEAVPSKRVNAPGTGITNILVERHRIEDPDLSIFQSATVASLGGLTISPRAGGISLPLQSRVDIACCGEIDLMVHQELPDWRPKQLL